MNSIHFQIISFFYSTLLIIIYFSKKRLKSVENNIYIKLLLVVFFALIFDVLSIFTIKYMNVIPIINEIVCKLYLALLLLWIILFTAYIFVVSHKQKKESNINKFYKKTFTFFKILYFIYLVILIFLPLHYKYENGIVYSYGSAANFSYLISGICVVLEVSYTLINFKNIRNKKLLPLFIFLALGITAILIQLNNPSILLISSVDTFITILMFFTIENPDLKLINELNIAKDQADRANTAKSEFLSSMSHEIRTPLNAIVGFSEALMEENLPDSAQEEVKDIIMASNSLLEIVNGILDISKIESGKIEIVNTEYQFREVYDNLVSLAKARLGEKPLEIRTSYDASIPNILYGDHSRVQQIILNILTNAIKYTKEGYIEFKVSSIVKDDICRLIISVEDSGIGIKQENIDKLFSKFERLDLENNVTIEGTGLGLAITKKLVDLMQGKIVVQSVYGKGSKFTIAIDQRVVHKQVVEEVVVKQEDKNIDVSGKKILIVDDNVINLKVASRLLENYKLDIETVDSGFSCIEKIESGNNYDLILMDDMMPKMSGVETLHKLKENSNFQIPVIALTANAISGMKEKYLEEGFNDYLAKPIDKTELNKIIIKYLNE